METKSTVINGYDYTKSNFAELTLFYLRKKMKLGPKRHGSKSGRLEKHEKKSDETC